MDLIQFDSGSGERIARVVQLVEQQPTPAKPLTFDTALVAGKSKTVFRVVTIDSKWDKGEERVVTFHNQTSTPNTVTAVNLLYDIASPNTAASETKICVIGKEGTAWYFVNDEVPSCEDSKAAEWLTSQGYSANSSPPSDGEGAQVLMNDNGCLKWVRLTQKDFVINVASDGNGGIEITKQKQYVFEASSGTDVTAIGCGGLGSSFTGGIVEVAGGLGSGSVSLSGDGCQKTIDVSITLNTEECA